MDSAIKSNPVDYNLKVMTKDELSNSVLNDENRPNNEEKYQSDRLKWSDSSDKRQGDRYALLDVSLQLLIFHTFLIFVSKQAILNELKDSKEKIRSMEVDLRKKDDLIVNLQEQVAQLTAE